MKALTYQDTGVVKYESIPDPQILSPTDVIVKVNACAICGSDLHVYHGREKGMDVHCAMGHEFTGEVVETGRDIKSLRKADRVMSPFTTNCGSCYYCLIGLTARCTSGQLFGWVAQGAGLNGGQAELVRVPLADTTLMKVPEEWSHKEALLLGDVLSTGYFCAAQAGVNARGVYAVVGLGPVGLMAVAGAIAQGAEKVFAVDQVSDRLAMAEKFGAVPLRGSDSPLDVVHAATEGRGVDAVMEAVGSGSAVSLAVQLVRPGGIVSSVGVCNDAHMAFSPVEAYNKNLTYRIGRCPARHYMEKLIPLVQSHRFALESVFTHEMPLAEGATGYRIFDRKEDHCMKVLLRP